ncbi:DUF2127 domain-containing protein [Luteimonas yindakuii]|uniref:DUF2127 domain-containing protein n=1 Tax=Luteimonas yindakuii TaxID=2565782 RepID=UPI0011079500|nr:DUF2127 domain-containing protein [Luteimonas yindakuii]QCU72686.1 DUF2127 domain-containing protein [Luteimonas yindakuii]
MMGAGSSVEVGAGTTPASPATQLRAVAVFEAGKGVVALLAAGALGWFGAPRLQQGVESVAAGIGAPLDGDRVAWLARALDGGTLDLVLAVLLVYAVLRFIEAWGLWRARGWASWLGCIGAAMYVPIEVCELWRHPGWLPAIVLAVNLAVVWVLGRDCLRRMRALPG